MDIYIMSYFGIGVVYSILFDILLRRPNVNQYLTPLEFIYSIVFWPFYVSLFIVQLLKRM